MNAADRLREALGRYRGVRDGFGYVTADVAVSTPAPEQPTPCSGCGVPCATHRRNTKDGLEHLCVSCWLSRDKSRDAPEQPSAPLIVQPSPAGVLVEDRLRNLSILQVEQPLQITCPFDWQQWRFHTQEQADKLQKHLDWHAKEGSK